MKRLCMVLCAILVAGTVSAATVVLKTGKRLDVARYESRGDLVVVFYPDGHAESYPASLVDRTATDVANAVAPAAPSPTPEAPRSPFLRAIAKSGESAAVIRDEDVRHVEREQPAEGEEKEEKKGEGGAEIVLSGYDRTQLEDGSWEVTANVTNQGGLPAKNVMVSVRALDAEGKVVGTGSGTLAEELAPGGQGTVKVKVNPSGDFVQLGFDLGWQEIRPQPTPAPQGKPAPGAAAPAAGAPGAGRSAEYGIPPGGSPNAVPDNPNAMPPLLTPPQVTPPSPPPQGGSGGGS